MGGGRGGSGNRRRPSEDRRRERGRQAGAAGPGGGTAGGGGTGVKVFSIFSAAAPTGEKVTLNVNDKMAYNDKENKYAFEIIRGSLLSTEHFYNSLRKLYIIYHQHPYTCMYLINLSCLFIYTYMYIFFFTVCPPSSHVWMMATMTVWILLSFLSLPQPPLPLTL